MIKRLLAIVLLVSCCCSAGSARFPRGHAAANTALPLQANIVTHFDAATPAISNGANVTTWTDTVNSIVAATSIGTVPTYSTNRLNGIAAVHCGAAGGLSIASPGALKTAIDSLTYTVFIVYRTLGSASNGVLFSATAGGSSFAYTTDGTNAIWNNNAASYSVPYSGSAFSTIGSTAATGLSYNSSGVHQGFYLDGGAVSSNEITPPATGGVTLSICDNAGNNFPVNAEIFDIVVWNVALTPPQYMQAQQWACDKFAQPYPWAGLSSFRTFFGDSITQGVSGLGSVAITQQPAYLAAQTLGLLPGQWHNIAVGGITTANMSVLAPTWVDPISALTGLKNHLIGFEWHNENGAPFAPPVPFNDANSYISARLAVSNQFVAWGTSTSEGSDPISNRATYDNAFDAAQPQSSYVYMPIHNDTHIGQNGAYNTFTPGGDTVHLSSTTYVFLGTIFSNADAALP